MTPDSSDPSVVGAIAVTVEDVVTAVETNRTTAKRAVLRLTPPYSGRMRARLHVEQADAYGGKPQPIHLAPARLLAEDAPSYPRPAQTEDQLREDPDRAYTVEHHRALHAEAVDDWREQIPSSIRDRVTLDTPAGSQQVDVVTLGEFPRPDLNGR